MACLTPLIPIDDDCEVSIGGIKKFYVIPADFITGTTLTNGITDDGNGTVTGITLSSTTSFTEFEWNTKANSASITEDVQNSFENGTQYVLQTITLSLKKRDLQKRNALQVLASGQRDLVIITLDNLGQYQLFGRYNYANLATNTGGSGLAKADSNSYDITFTAEEPELAPFVDPTIIPGLI
jgi:hypothetical protein